MSESLKTAVKSLVDAARKEGVKEQTIVGEIREAWLAAVADEAKKPPVESTAKAATK